MGLGHAVFPDAASIGETATKAIVMTWRCIGRREWVVPAFKFEIRISKSETNSNTKMPNPKRF
jgi:hypothetical protein